ncbi:hypothetical protein H5410_047569 [Solanum commersonii]|uniref:Uncharacterized protein n=1 Tax=Solanum commersonii TaxID=4109 RepID=A0A9J5XHP4_SOLCO|nr:hypothetical protein H5410_047569 [Solanum commersonii]
MQETINDLFQFKGAKEIDMDEVQRWILSLLKPEKTSILCHPNVETGRRGKPFRGVNKVEALIRRKYPLKYDASSDRKT